MSSSDPTACRCSPPGEAPPAERPRCCCESRCTCRHCHGNTQHRHHHRSRHTSRARAEAEVRESGPRSARRCTSCLPEQAELGEADLLVRQQRCGEARLAEQQRRADLAAAVHHRGSVHCCPTYMSNTAELLRRRSTVACQAAVDSEYDARRRTLQAELDARRGEIAALRRAREEQQMSSAHCEREVVQRCCHVATQQRRSRSADHRRVCSTKRHPSSPPPPPPQPTKAPSAGEQQEAAHVEAATELPPPPPQPAPREHHHNHFHHRRASPCGRRSSSPPQHAQCRRPPPPPPPPSSCWQTCAPSCRCGCASAAQHQNCCPLQQQRQQRPHSSARVCTSRPSSAASAACPSCSGALLTARDIVSLIAAGKLESSVACPACGFVGGRLPCAPAHRGPSPQDPPSAIHAGGVDSGAATAAEDGAKRHPSRVPSSGPHPRSSSAAAAPSRSSSGSLTNPRYGRKVFITDDLHRDRRARYLAEWEARGAVRRVPPSSRSPSAPLPERTPKWRTTGCGTCSE